MCLAAIIFESISRVSVNAQRESCYPINTRIAKNAWKYIMKVLLNYVIAIIKVIIMELQIMQIVLCRIPIGLFKVFFTREVTVVLIKNVI